MTRSDRILTLSKSFRMIEASIAKADTISVACSVAIVDHTGNLLHFVRQDSAFSGSAELAINKAFTAQIFNKRTDELALLAQPGGSSSASSTPMAAGLRSSVAEYRSVWTDTR